MNLDQVDASGVPALSPEDAAWMRAEFDAMYPATIAGPSVNGSGWLVVQGRGGGLPDVRAAFPDALDAAEDVAEAVDVDVLGSDAERRLFMELWHIVRAAD